MYLALDLSAYGLAYHGRVRIIRTADHSVVWKSTCKIDDSDNPVRRVPVEDFLAGSGTRFRSAARYATDQCADQLLHDFISGG